MGERSLRLSVGVENPLQISRDLPKCHLNRKCLRVPDKYVTLSLIGSIVSTSCVRKTQPMQVVLFGIFLVREFHALNRSRMLQNFPGHQRARISLQMASKI